MYKEGDSWTVVQTFRYGRPPSISVLKIVRATKTRVTYTLGEEPCRPCAPSKIPAAATDTEIEEARAQIKRYQLLARLRGMAWETLPTATLERVLSGQPTLGDKEHNNNG